MNDTSPSDHHTADGNKIPESSSLRPIQESENAKMETSAGTVRAKSEFGPSSPSPRGIESWGLCSPFFLPGPSNQIDFLASEEISRILDGPDLGESRKEAEMSEQDRYVLPKSEFVDLEVILKVPDLPFPSYQGPIDADAMERETALETRSRLESDESNRFIRNLFAQNQLCEQTTDHVMLPQEWIPIRSTKTPNLQLENFHATNLTSRMNEETIAEVGEPNGPASVVDYGQDIEIMTDLLGIEHNESQEQELSIEVECAMADGKEIREENSPHAQRSRDKQSGAPSQKHQGGESAEKMKGKVKCPLIPSEEELKRIRRVKNRASVEKCRAKQRLRMEALESEMQALESENQTLRDLTNWMDSSVETISSQMAHFEE